MFGWPDPEECPRDKSHAGVAEKLDGDLFRQRNTQADPLIYVATMWRSSLMYIPTDCSKDIF
jgi:hypothetical protein